MGVLRRWVLGIVVVTARLAFADGRNGPPSALDLTEQFVRIGPSSLAFAPQSVFDGEATQQQNVSEVRFYVDEVHQSGTVVLSHSLGLSSTATVTSPGWVSFTFAPLTLTVVGPFQLTLSPQGSTEFTLRHVPHTFEGNHQFGGWQGPLVTLRESARLSSARWNVSSVLRLSGVDPYAGSDCGSAQRDAVAGFPYVRLWHAPLSQTQGRTERFFFPHYQPPPVFLGTCEVHLNSAVTDYRRLGYALHAGDGGFISDGPFSLQGAPYPDFYWTPLPVVSSFDDAGFSEPFEVTVTTDGGGAWTVLDTGAQLLDECDPAVRATYGGHGARATDLPPGADYLLRLMPESGIAVYQDQDGDRFGAPDSRRWIRPGRNPGVVYVGGDCDDTRADAHPDAGEQCNGLDDDCDGLIDEAAKLPSMPCDQPGVCRLGTKVCAAGAWQTCEASRFGVTFHEETCDGLDNDCDGVVDDAAPTPLCAEQRGVCAGSVAVCSSGTVLTCDALRFGPEFHAETCDGLDNDCDGEIDEGGQRACDQQEGVCEGSLGACGVACGASNYGSAYEAEETTRDGLDNDCDGEVDEEAPPRGCGCSDAGGPLLFLLCGLLLRRDRAHQLAK
ncbi:MAG: putative metal-binding motif-containing protein [Archangium sp.]|nr:putative metal-binding motif-containing protein [Archangium sp.]MDP3575440.1 putative metal-binding motif-containing protein [Archangium sp.]